LAEVLLRLVRERMLTPALSPFLKLV